MLHRRNIFKNIVFNFVDEIRAEKRKPKLGQVLKVFERFKNDKSGRSFIIDKLRALYSNNNSEILDEKREDKKYTELMRWFNRLHKSFTSQSDQLKELEIRLSILLNRRKFREENPRKWRAMQIQMAENEVLENHRSAKHEKKHQSVSAEVRKLEIE